MVGTSPHVHFCGTLWDENVCELAMFSRGCLNSNIPFFRHGKSFLPEDIWNSRDIVNNCGNVSWTEDETYLSSERRDKFVEISRFGLALQGMGHLAGNDSYISDRTLLAASLGQLVVTNNPVIQSLLRGFEDLYVYSPHLETLCNSANMKAKKVQPKRRAQMVSHIAERHTYASRFADITKMLVHLSSNFNISDISKRSRGRTIEKTPKWCKDLDKIKGLAKILPKQSCTVGDCGCGPPYNEPWCSNLIEGIPEAIFWCKKYKNKPSCHRYCGGVNNVEALLCPNLLEGFNN